jgi:hypothetical protein
LERLHFDTDPAALDAAVPDDGVGDFLHDLGGNRETEAVGEHEGARVDAHDFARQIDERASRCCPD